MFGDICLYWIFNVFLIVSSIIFFILKNIFVSMKIRHRKRFKRQNTLLLNGHDIFNRTNLISLGFWNAYLFSSSIKSIQMNQFDCIRFSCFFFWTHVFYDIESKIIYDFLNWSVLNRHSFFVNCALNCIRIKVTYHIHFFKKFQQSNGKYLFL